MSSLLIIPAFLEARSIQCPDLRLKIKCLLQYKDPRQRASLGVRGFSASLDLFEVDSCLIHLLGKNWLVDSEVRTFDLYASKDEKAKPLWCQVGFYIAESSLACWVGLIGCGHEELPSLAWHLVLGTVLGSVSGAV